MVFSSITINHPFGGTPICGNPHLGPFGGNDSPMTSIDGLGPGSLGLNNSIQQSFSTCDILYIYVCIYIYIRICIYTYIIIKYTHMPLYFCIFYSAKKTNKNTWQTPHAKHDWSNLTTNFIHTRVFRNMTCLKFPWLSPCAPCTVSFWDRYGIYHVTSRRVVI